MIVVAIVGSRTFWDPARAQSLVATAVSRIATTHPDATIVTGGARGVDTWAEEAAARYGLSCRVIRPDWDKHGKAAGLIRNTEIIRQATHVLAFHNGFSRGTRDSIKKSQEAGKPTKVWVENEGNSGGSI